MFDISDIILFLKKLMIVIKGIVENKVKRILIFNILIISDLLFLLKVFVSFGIDGDINIFVNCNGILDIVFVELKIVIVIGFEKKLRINVEFCSKIVFVSVREKDERDGFIICFIFFKL